MSAPQRPPLYDDETAADFARRQLRLSAVCGVAVLALLLIVGLAAFVVRSTDMVILAGAVAVLILAGLVVVSFTQLAHLTAFTLRRKVH